MDLTLQVEPTRMCNQNCSICMRRNLRNSYSSLSLDYFKEICDSIPSTFRYIALHGWGEPLLNMHIFDMVKYADEIGFSTNLTTNGTLISDRMEDIFASGLSDICFGVYDMGLLRKIAPSIMALLKVRETRGSEKPKIYVDITIYRDNLYQIIDIIKTAHEIIGVDAIILHRLFNVYNVSPSVRYITPQEEEELFAQVRNFSMETGAEIYLPGGHTYPCKVVKYSIFVTVEGVVTPCVFLPEYTLGNAVEINAILKSTRYRNFIAHISEHYICRRCRW